MNIKNFLIELNGRKTGKEISMLETIELSKLGLVIAFGYGDESITFRGAINDKVGCYEGGKIFINDKKVFKECESKCEHEVLAKYKIINVLWWELESVSWTFETDIPHESFNILDDDKVFCKGILFNIKDLVIL